jgi:hypothetical protein
MNINNHKNKIRIIALTLIAGYLASCTGGGGGAISVTGTVPVGSSSIGITNVYPSSQAATFATPTSASRYYVKGLSASIKGTCSRGVATIKVNEGGPDYTETASCQNDGSFVWSKTYSGAQEGDKTLSLSAYDVAGVVIAGVTASTTVRIDNTAPAATTLVSPASSPYDYTGSASTYTIQMTGAADVFKVLGPASVQLTFNSPNFEHIVPLVPGSTSTYTFYAYDLAGNQSTGTSVQIGYVPSADLKIGGAYLGGPVTDGVSLYKVESTVAPESNRTIDSGTSYILETGFNYIMNQVRAN